MHMFYHLIVLNVVEYCLHVLPGVDGARRVAECQRREGDF